jgi:hypothetical protein
LLDALGDIRKLEMKIRTTDELAGSASTSSEPSDRRQAGSIDQLSTSVQAKRLPIEDYLERFLEERPLESAIVEGNQKDRAALTPRERKLTYINRVISTSELAMAHAWALRRLAEAFPLEKLRPLHVPYSWMLQDMLDDHSKAIGEQINIMTELIQPLLSQFCSFGSQEAISGGDDLSDDVELADLTGTMRLFRKLKRIEGLTLSIFSENESQNELFQADAQKLLSSVLNLRSNLDALGHQTSYTYTWLNQLANVTDPEGLRVEFLQLNPDSLQRSKETTHSSPFLDRMVTVSQRP